MTYNKNLSIKSANVVSISGSHIELTGSTYGSYVSGTIGEFTTLTASNLVAGGVKYPTSDGDAGQILVTDGVGNLGFQDITLTINVKNLEATTITKGTPLYVTASGTSGNIAGVYRADAGNENRMPAACVADQNIAAGAEGLAILSGFISGVDTSTFASGEEVYVAVGGGYTNIRPTGSAKVQPLGYVEKVDLTNGSGIVKGPGHFWELPNITAGHFWVGASNGVPTTVASSSFAKLADNNTFTGTNNFSILTASAIDVDTITAREYYTELVSASIIYESGSTKFGNSSDDTHQFTGSVNIDGTLTATAKSFDIEHPTKQGMRLRYGSLEGAENGVYVRGLTTQAMIELPEHWTGLVDEETITVNLTPVGSYQTVWVDKIEENKVYIGGNLVKCYFTVFGERKDIPKLLVEY